MELKDLRVWGLDDEFNPLRSYFHKEIENPDKDFDPKRWAIEICENVLKQKGNLSRSEK